DAAADRAGDGARELEAAEAGRAGAVEADGVRGAAAGPNRLAVHLDGGELAGELQDEGVDAAVRREEVGAEADHRDRQLLLRRPAEQLRDFAFALGPREGPGRPTSAERREPGERGGAVDVAGAERQDSVPRARPARDDACGVVELRRPADPQTGPHAGELVD